jgi:hypothetical protein
MGARAKPWRPKFLDSAHETAELAAELATLVEHIQREHQSTGTSPSTRERVRLDRLIDWATQLDKRPADGQVP